MTRESCREPKSHEAMCGPRSITTSHLVTLDLREIRFIAFVLLLLPAASPLPKMRCDALLSPLACVRTAVQRDVISPAYVTPSCKRFLDFASARTTIGESRPTSTGRRHAAARGKCPDVKIDRTTLSRLDERDVESRQGRIRGGAAPRAGRSDTPASGRCAEVRTRGRRRMTSDGSSRSAIMKW